MQYDFGVIDPFTDDGVELANKLNQWRDAVYTMMRGPTRPAWVVPGQMWVDDSGGAGNWLCKYFISTDVGDVVMFSIDSTTGTIVFNSEVIGDYLQLSGGTIDGNLTVNGFVQAQNLAAQATLRPILELRATQNPTDTKNWRAYVNETGNLVFAAMNDALNAEIVAPYISRGALPANDKSKALATTEWVQQLFSLAAPPGMIVDGPFYAAPPGWLLVQGGFIGNAVSGADKRANADTLPLFRVMWGATDNVNNPVYQGGVAVNRGANADADFNANRKILLFDYRGVARFHYDNGAGRLTLVSSNMGAKFGAQQHGHNVFGSGATSDAGNNYWGVDGGNQVNVNLIYHTHTVYLTSAGTDAQTHLPPGGITGSIIKL